MNTQSNTIKAPKNTNPTRENAIEGWNNRLDVSANKQTNKQTNKQNTYTVYKQNVKPTT